MLAPKILLKEGYVYIPFNFPRYLYFIDFFFQLRFLWIELLIVFVSNYLVLKLYWSLKPKSTIVLFQSHLVFRLVSWIIKVTFCSFSLIKVSILKIFNYLHVFLLNCNFHFWLTDWLLEVNQIVMYACIPNKTSSTKSTYLSAIMRSGSQKCYFCLILPWVICFLNILYKL